MSKRGDKISPSISPARNTKLYSTEHIAKIIAELGIEIPPERHEALAGGLEQAAQQWRLQKILQINPTASELQAQFTRIERAANNLLKELGVEDVIAPPARLPVETQDPVSDKRIRRRLLNTIPKSILDQIQLAAIGKAAAFGKSGESLLQESVAGVVQLKQWSKKLASAAAERESKRIKLSRQKSPRRSESRTLQYWINDLFRIYRDIGGRKSSVTWNEYAGIYTGEFFCFVRSSLEIIGYDISDTALAKNIQRAKEIREEN